jgi:senataxin
MSASSSASSSRLPPPSSSLSSPNFTPPPRLVANLAELRDPDRVTDEGWNKTTEETVIWLLSLHPPYAGGGGAEAAGKGKGKERAPVDDEGVATDESLVHWFCGAKGAQGCWEPATFCIRLLGMKKQGEVATWREKIDRCVFFSCSAVSRSTPLENGEKERESFHASSTS